MKIIMINGKKRSGKDYLAKMLAHKLKQKDKTTKIMSFAEPLKAIVATTFGITTEELEKYKNNPEMYNIVGFNGDIGFMETNFRKILQLFGTESTKPYFGDTVWSDLLKTKAQRAGVDFVLVPDFRFRCENDGELTIKVQNDSTESADSHVSENELNDFNFDFVINNTNYKDINEDVDLLVQELLKLK